MTYTLVIHSHERRAGCAALLGLQFRARVDRQLAVGWLRTGAATAVAHRSCILSQTHRSLRVLLCVYGCCTKVCPVRFLFDLKSDVIFRFENPIGRVVRFGPTLTTWAIGFSNQIYPVGFWIIGPHKKTYPFCRSKGKNLKLGIGSRKNQPNKNSSAIWLQNTVISVRPPE